MQKPDLVQALSANLGADAVPRQDGDYIDASDGLLRCGRCHAPKERVLPVPAILREEMGDTIKRPCECTCQWARRAQEAEAFEARRHTEAVNRLRAAGIHDARLRECTFSADDGQDVKTCEICRRYVGKWDKVKAERIGLLLWGETGCGKTFYAAAIANALIEHETKVVLTSIPDLSARMLANYGEGREEVLEEVRRVPLLILDDVGFERSTQTGMENAFSVVDARYDSGKPLIITTNLTPDEIQNPADVAHKRTLSRIAELCAVPVHVEGSRREGIARDRRMRALETLLDD